jgi:hypothetical protein
MIDWSEIETSLWERGFAPLGKLLTDAQCDRLKALYVEPKHFRSRIDMQRYRFGSGEYQYFAYPLPDKVASLRSKLYERLAPVANRWVDALKLPGDYPTDHADFLKYCHENDQASPTPLMLRYRAGDYNCLHQDIYGEIVFPFQVIFSLSAPGEDFTGGELMLVEQRPRAQSVGHSLTINKGEAVVITTRYRLAKGSRGFYRTSIKHGVSEIRSGERFTLGIIFHDAK